MDLLLWDIQGHREYRKRLIDARLRGTSGILAVADMTRRTTLGELGGWIQHVENVAGEVPVVVIGADRDPANRRVVSEEDVRRLAASHGAACFFAAANATDPVEGAFLLLAERIAKRRILAGGDAAQVPGGRA